LPHILIFATLKNMLKTAEEDKKEALNKELEEMFMAGVHFGYSRQSRHPKMEPCIFGLRNNVEIFDLEKTYACLEKAKKFLESLAKEGKKILIVATKPGIHQLVEEAGRELNMPYVSERWLGGILTNFKIIKARIDYFTSLRQKKATGELNKYTKKEISLFTKELSRLERFLGGLEPLTSLPDAVLIIDPKKEKTAFCEAKQMLIPVIAVLNSDSDPTGIAYPIPANDSSPASVKYLIIQLVKAYKSGIAPSLK
jgi:small subunit ribosomal protein S2